MDSTQQHNEFIKNLITPLTATGFLKSREGTTVEFKENFSKGNYSKYAKTMASFANNKGGYIIFGITDKPRTIKGMQSDAFNTFEQEKFTDLLNLYFAPAIDWECGSIELHTEAAEDLKKIGWIYTYEAENKPIIAQKNSDGEKFSNGDILYRYRARSQKIKYAEMHAIISECARKAREHLYKLIETIKRAESTNLGIVNYSNGKFSTPYGIDVEFDKRLVAKVLKKAKFIKEGSFDEKEGAPVIKVTGSIDLAEEVPIPEGDPDKTHPFIQKQLAQMLGITLSDLYALIFYFKMKESKKYHLEITTSNKGKIHKFSQFACDFLKQKLEDLYKNEEEFDKIRDYYKKNKKIKECKHG